MKFSTVNWRTVYYMFSNLCDSTSSLPIITEMGKYEIYFWWIARFVIICTIQKKWKTSYPATLLKVTHLHGCISRFLNCTNGTKSRNASHMLWWLVQIWKLKLHKWSIFQIWAVENVILSFCFSFLAHLTWVV